MRSIFFFLLFKNSNSFLPFLMSQVFPCSCFLSSLRIPISHFLRVGLLSNRSFFFFPSFENVLIPPPCLHDIQERCFCQCEYCPIYIPLILFHPQKICTCHLASTVNMPIFSIVLIFKMYDYLLNMESVDLKDLVEFCNLGRKLFWTRILSFPYKGGRTV